MFEGRLEGWGSRAAESWRIVTTWGYDQLFVLRLIQEEPDFNEITTSYRCTLSESLPEGVQCVLCTVHCALCTGQWAVFKEGVKASLRSALCGQIRLEVETKSKCKFCFLLFTLFSAITHAICLQC